MAVTIWGSSSSWTLTALPLFVWMGEILFRTRLSQDMFQGLAPWMQRLPGPPAAHQRRRLRDLRRGVGLERRHLRDHRQDDPARAGASAATPSSMSIGSLAGAGTLGLLIPPSIIMIVYGVTADVSISQLFIAGVMPGHPAGRRCSRGYIVGWALLQPGPDPAGRPADDASREKLRESRSLIPVVLLIVARARLDLRRHRHRHRGRRRSACVGALAHLGRAGLAELADLPRLADGRARGCTA